jgi:hypothetical protein
LHRARPTTALLLSLLVACSSTTAGERHVPPFPSYVLELQPNTLAIARRTEAGGAAWEATNVFTLRNSGTHSFPWLLESSAPWLGFLRATNGILAPGGIAAIELAIETAGAPTTTGRHVARVRILNAFTFHCEAQLDVVWVVGDASRQ